jgi:hypothetical protein
VSSSWRDGDLAIPIVKHSITWRFATGEDSDKWLGALESLRRHDSSDVFGYSLCASAAKREMKTCFPYLSHYVV